MLLSVDLNQFDNNNVLFSYKTKNNVLVTGDFYRISYSDEFMCLNSVFIHFNLKNVLIEPYFNKTKCNFDINSNKEIILKIKEIEREILSRMNIQKRPVYRIEEQLVNGFIKIFDEINDKDIKSIHQTSILLKISGIWANNAEYGTTFRFFFIHR